MAYPATDIAQAIAGEFIDTAEWNALVDALNFLADPPACRVYHNAAQSIADATEVTVAFNSERYDTAAMHDTVTNNSRITIPVAGLYLVEFEGALAAGADYTMFYIYLRLNGATNIRQVAGGTVADASTAGPTLVLSTVYKFAVGDYVEARLLQNNTANTARNLLAAGAHSPELTATWVGRG